MTTLAERATSERETTMGLGVGIFLAAVGAVLAFAVTDTVSGVDIHAVGWILLIVGVIGRLSDGLRRALGFAEVRFVGDDAARDELVLLDAALEERRAVADRARVAIPLLAERACLGYLIADRGAAPLALGEADLPLL